MTNATVPEFLDAHNWAKLVAYLWLRPKFADDFENDPVLAVVNAQNPTDGTEPIQLDYVFKFDDPSQRTKMLQIPDNPGYDPNDLNDAIFGLTTIVPMTSWNIHGLSSPEE